MEISLPTNVQKHINITFDPATGTFQGINEEFRKMIDNLGITFEDKNKNADKIINAVSAFEESQRPKYIGFDPRLMTDIPECDEGMITFYEDHSVLLQLTMITGFMSLWWNPITIHLVRRLESLNRPWHLYRRSNDRMK